MTEWIRCTRAGSGEAVFVNRARAVSVSRRDENTTAIIFADSEGDCILIQEPPEAFLRTKPFS